jgi:hypothetical protein
MWATPAEAWSAGLSLLLLLLFSFSTALDASTSASRPLLMQIDNPNTLPFIFNYRSMGQNVTEEDLYGSAVREPMCHCCSQLAQALASLPADGSLVASPAQLKAAAEQLKVNTAQHVQVSVEHGIR